jgi:hypothetical protein
VWAVSVVAASCVVVSVSVDRRCRCCCAAACRLHPLDQAFVFHCVKCVFVETDLSVPETSIRDNTCGRTPNSNSGRADPDATCIAGSGKRAVSHTSRTVRVRCGARGCQLKTAEVPGSADGGATVARRVADSPSVGRPRNRTYRA